MTTSRRMIRFGGPNLPEEPPGRYVTWFMARGMDGNVHQIFARAGDIYPANEIYVVGPDLEDGTATYRLDPDYYVNSGRASYVEDSPDMVSGASAGEPAGE